MKALHLTLDKNKKNAFYVSKKNILFRLLQFLFVSTNTVIAQDPFWTGFIGWLYSYKRKLIIEVHGDFLPNKFAIWVLKKADLIRVVNPIIKNQLAALGIYNVFVKPVAVNKFTEGESIKCDYLYIGRLEKEKGVYDMVDYFNKTGQSLTVVGTGSQEKRLKKIAGRNITFVGFVKNVAPYYKGCNCVVNFAPREGYGRIYKEAMKFNKHIMTKDTIGAKYLLKNYSKKIKIK